MIDKANALVMGNSGSGKSTLINSVFNFECAAVGNGDAVTKVMKIYETEDVNFRAIDTKGLEYGMLAQLKTKHAIKKWSKDSLKKNNEGKSIHIIWYCVDATSKRIFGKNLDTIKNVATMWKNIPIIIVLTKSYSETETVDNINMVNKCLDNYKNNKYLNVIDIIPVVAQQFPINNETIIPPIGVNKLVEKTNDIIPESFKINKKGVFELNLRIKRFNANAMTITATSGAVVIGAVPIPFADSAILMPLQGYLVINILKIYDIKKEGGNLNSISETIISCGVITIGAKTIISSLKLIPGLNLAAAVINAIVAAVITAVLGEITIAIMEKVVSGEVDPNDLDWIKNFTDSQFMDKVGKYISKFGKNLEDKNLKNIGKIIADIFKDFSNKKSL